MKFDLKPFSKILMFGISYQFECPSQGCDSPDCYFQILERFCGKKILSMYLHKLYLVIKIVVISPGFYKFVL